MSDRGTTVSRPPRISASARRRWVRKWASQPSLEGSEGSNPFCSTLQSLRVETSGESFEKTRIEAGFWHSGGSREQADLALLVRNFTKLSDDDFRGPHPRSRACARFAVTERRTTAADSLI